MTSIATRRKVLTTFAAVLVAAAVAVPVGLPSSGDSLDRFLANDGAHHTVRSPDVVDALDRFLANTAQRPASDAFDRRSIADAAPGANPQAPSGAGFDWTATAIGLAAGLAALLIVAAGAIYTRRGQLRAPRVG